MKIFLKKPIFKVENQTTLDDNVPQQDTSSQSAEEQKNST